MTVAILSIGTELLLGQTRDTNFPFLAGRLRDAGARVVWHATVPDELPAMIAALREALARAELVITVGGLGPTVDDRTREAIVAVTGRPLALDENVLETIRARFASRNLTMTEINRVQALVPRGAEVLPNPNGTAPGLYVPLDGGTVVALPGPPRELEPMVESHLISRVASHIAQGGGAKREHLTFRTIGLPESTLAERLAPHLALLERHDVAFLPHGGQVDVRVTFAGGDADARDREAIRTVVREAAGHALFAEGERRLEEVIGEHLRARAATIAVAESCTAGNVVERLIRPAGASSYVQGGVVAYSDRAKTDLLGVPADMIATSGAVSEEVARAMARGVRDRFGGDAGVSTTGIAGPAGERPGKPVGLVFIGVTLPEGEIVERHVFGGGREEVTARATLVALDLLRRSLAGVVELAKTPELS
jgi:nicotinamide-nucleotide amidase